MKVVRSKHYFYYILDIITDMKQFLTMAEPLSTNE